jgi:hypothetical protein
MHFQPPTTSRSIYQLLPLLSILSNLGTRILPSLGVLSQTRTSVFFFLFDPIFSTQDSYDLRSCRAFK